MHSQPSRPPLLSPRFIPSQSPKRLCTSLIAQEKATGPDPPTVPSLDDLRDANAPVLGFALQVFGQA